MQVSQKRKVGRTALDVTLMGFGAAPIGNFLRTIAEAESEAMIHAAWQAGIRYFDTAPMYGHGLSEARIGHGLRWYPRKDFVLSTKVGRLLKAKPRSQIDFRPWVDALPFEVIFDYSYDGTLRSIEDSLQRLGLESIDIAFIHDCDTFTHGDRQPEVFRQAMDGAGRALIRLRDEGVVKAIGLGVNEWEVCLAALRQQDFDCFLLAGRYTLLEQEALNEFLPLCQQRNAAVVLGAGYNSGILATGAVPGAKYNYAPAPPAIMEKVRRIEAVCKRHAVPLKAAALQFVLGHPCIVTNVLGTRTVAQLEDNIAQFKTMIPIAFWEALKQEGLVREDAPLPMAD